jgi:hypothetical protein
MNAHLTWEDSIAYFQYGDESEAYGSYPYVSYVGESSEGATY